MSGRTLYTMFLDTVKSHADRPALAYRTDKASALTTWTYRELDVRVNAVRRGLNGLGLTTGDRVAILAENRAEWILVDLASQALGLIVVAPYSSLPYQQAGYIVQDSGARILFCSDAKQTKKADQFRKDCPLLEFVVVMDTGAAANTKETVLEFDQFLEFSRSSVADSELDAIADSVVPDHPALLIYTSGTTGEPKGAMLSHRNMLQTPDGVVKAAVADIGPDDRFLSFLPLSHITERVGGYYLPIRVGASITFSLGLAQIGQEITETIRPTVMLCVPRIFENMHSKFLDSVAKLEEDKRVKLQWGLQMGLSAATARSEGRSLGLVNSVRYFIAEKLILSKIRDKVTGGKIRFFVSGGAPLDVQTATFFLGIGIQILEGYGLSETNIIAINRPSHQRIGTVGTIMPDVELKIADDGEILMRGQGRMLGYYNRPEETAEVIDPDGWLHTGDVGEISQDGYLKITDRKKDIIVLTNGKKVAPQPIEALLKQSPYIAEAVLYGDRQSTVMALIVPNFGKLIEMAKEQSLTLDPAELIETANVQKLIKTEIDAATRSLADYEKIKRFRILGKPFGIESGELTPTLKVKRRFVAEKYADVIAGMSRQDRKEP